MIGTNGLNGADVRGAVEEDRSEKCMICGGPPRNGWNEEVILAPASGDGFREAQGFVHPRCLKERIEEVVDHIECTLPSIAIIDIAEAERVSANVVFLRGRIKANDGYFNAVTLEIARIVRRLVEETTAASGRARLAWKLIEAFSFLGQSLFLETKPSSLKAVDAGRKAG